MQSHPQAKLEASGRRPFLGAPLQRGLIASWRAGFLSEGILPVHKTSRAPLPKNANLDLRKDSEIRKNYVMEMENTMGSILGLLELTVFSKEVVFQDPLWLPYVST